MNVIYLINGKFWSLRKPINAEDTFTTHNINDIIINAYLTGENIGAMKVLTINDIITSLMGINVSKAEINNFIKEILK